MSPWSAKTPGEGTMSFRKEFLERAIVSTMAVLLVVTFAACAGRQIRPAESDHIATPVPTPSPTPTRRPRPRPTPSPTPSPTPIATPPQLPVVDSGTPSAPPALPVGGTGDVTRAPLTKGIGALVLVVRGWLPQLSMTSWLLTHSLTPSSDIVENV